MENGFYHLTAANGRKVLFYCREEDVDKVVAFAHKYNAEREAEQKFVEIECGGAVTEVPEIVPKARF